MQGVTSFFGHMYIDTKRQIHEILEMYWFVHKQLRV